jgi:holo-[acyl-carrier protein] synthase
MILRTGVDIIEIERIESVLARHEERFLERVYTQRERDLFRGSAEEIAARFAAKEAVSKALGTGIGPVFWREIETLRNRAGAPVLHLHGQARQIADRLGLTNWSVSLSHSNEHAIAFVVAMGEENIL